MPISTTAGDRRSGRRRFDGQAGFTLLEVSLVILILGVMLVFVVPRFRDRGRAEMLSQARRLALTFRLLRDEAVLNGSPLRLNYDLDQQRYWVTPHEASTVDLAQFAADIGSLARGTKLGPEVAIADVSLPMMGVKIAQGQLFTVFYPDGSVDITVIHLTTATQTYTLWFEPRSQRLRSREGYWDPSYGS